MSAFIIWAAVCAAAAALFVAWPMLRPATGLPASRTAARCRRRHPGGARRHAAVSYWRQLVVARRRAHGGRRKRRDVAGRHAGQTRDIQAWLDLRRAYLRIAQWPLARRSFQHAEQLSKGGNSAALAGLAETIVFENSGNETPEAEALFERALALDPHSPQALFYTGVALLNGGQLPAARHAFRPCVICGRRRRSWTRSTSRLPPSTSKSPAASRTRRPHTPAGDIGGQAHGPGAAWRDAVRIRAFTAGGPPLAAKRLAAQFPQQIDLSAADAVMAANRINAGQQVEVMARVSRAARRPPALAICTEKSARSPVLRRDTSWRSTGSVPNLTPVEFNIIYIMRS